jgi:ABC-type nitrate/sulfonate/bicarbonate transport system substrate-binding protein
LAALRGLRIGAAPGPDDGLRELLRRAGYDPEQCGVQIGPIPGTNESGVSFGVTAARALELGLIDGFWANAMGAEVAVRRGIGTVVLDVRRGDGPPEARHYTFPALVTRDALIHDDPDRVAAATRAIRSAQRALAADPAQATEVGTRLFPPLETQLIADLIRLDLPYYDPSIRPESVEHLNRFAQSIGILHGPVPYERVVATQFSHLWA